MCYVGLSCNLIGACMIFYSRTNACNPSPYFWDGHAHLCIYMRLNIMVLHVKCVYGGHMGRPTVAVIKRWRVCTSYYREAYDVAWSQRVVGNLKRQCMDSLTKHSWCGVSLAWLMWWPCTFCWDTTQTNCTILTFSWVPFRCKRRWPS